MSKRNPYNSGSLREAWREFCIEHPKLNSPVNFSVFRAGFRRGFAEGARVATTTFVCTTGVEE